MRNKLFLAIVTTVILLFSTNTSVSAQNNPANSEYKEALSKMLTLSGALAAVDMMLPQIITVMKQAAPNAPDSLWNNFATKCKSKFGDKLIELYVPIYEKYLTLDDVNQLIDFYQSPIGKKLSSATPKITMESMQIGQKIGMEIATELQNELKAGGYQ